MKGILIDAVNREIKEVEHNNIGDCYQLIGCGLVEVAGYFDNEDCVYCDEEGMLKYSTCGLDGFEIDFGTHKNVVAGNGLVVGTDYEGETVACVSTLDDIKKVVTFVTVQGMD